MGGLLFLKEEEGVPTRAARARVAPEEIPHVADGGLFLLEFASPVPEIGLEEVIAVLEGHLVAHRLLEDEVVSLDVLQDNGTPEHPFFFIEEIMKLEFSGAFLVEKRQDKFFSAPRSREGF